VTTVAAHGLRVALPARWEARLYRRERPDQPAWRVRHPNAYGSAEEVSHPVLHLANFALPAGRGDFGTGAVELMRPAHAFVAVVEFDPEEAGRPLFAARGLPRPELGEFAPNALQRRLPGQLGYQRFCTEHGRPFSVYAVLGSRHHAARLVEEVRAVLAGVTVDAAAHPPRSRSAAEVRPHRAGSGGRRG
jgi:hypothetical protein